ncbi:hypothetical protein EIN_153810 [Entamoeba invadens IP1]|uniref:Uncharacterized protein n=1 Tax=Entamoeba invadens IP1 TaxID=370355 RepID=A0A0A1U8W7_ENTIV|nr:hypothetical protein EIN_153810 [Entamoeba invadens IP1]ELP91344.1 hypothetical protein EIN_153810 [Entamoeba invadens IP1]|eukprot:XP_004258115.1 hypothetical protein EIN_153810 [Entamoeba invadens IP1]
MLIVFMLPLVLSLRCQITTKYTFVRGTTTIPLPSVHYPHITFTPELDGTFFISQTETGSEIYVTVLRPQDITVCVVETDDTPSRLTAKVFSLNYVLKSIVPGIPLYFVLVAIVFIIVIFIMLIKAFGYVVATVTDVYFNQGKRLEKYFNDKFGISHDELVAFLIHKGVVQENAEYLM